MKWSFTSPTQNEDGSPVTASELSALVYFLFVDTVNPPVSKFQVPTANVTAATKNADGSITVSGNDKDLSGFTLPGPGTHLFLAAEDQFGVSMSPETPVITYTVPTPIPNAPGNFTVA